MAMLDWEKASGSDSSKGRAFLFTAGVSTGFYICFSWTTREGTMGTSRATIYMYMEASEWGMPLTIMKLVVWGS